MSGTSSKSKVVCFRITNEDYALILRAINIGNGQASTPSEYCQIVIHRWIHRHDKVKKGGDVKHNFVSATNNIDIMKPFIIQ